MRASFLLIAATLTLSAQASWFGGSSSTSADQPHSTKTLPDYTNWNKAQLQSWLEIHNIPIPQTTHTQAQLRELVAEHWDSFSVWTNDQYASAQQAFSNLRSTSFEKWDESKLREFLLERGVIAPKGPREKLVLLAKAKYREYEDAAKTLGNKASDAASTAVYGDTSQQISKSASSLASQATSAVAQATGEAGRAFDETKHYVYSTWDEGQMRAYLVEKGLLKSKERKKKEELLAMMHDAWGRAADPVWGAWSDSYIHHWLVDHHVIKSDYEKNRDKLTHKMNTYYYSTKDTVYSNWTDSQLHQWLVNHGIMKSEAQASRDKMIKMVEDNYLSARDTFWSAWSDSALHNWLTEHGYLRTDAQVKRDKLVKLADEKWNEERARAQAYLTWPDARLRAYLREQGVNEKHIPGDRPGLLQETRIRWVMTQSRAEKLFQKIKDLVNSGVYKTEDALLRLVHLLGTGWEEAKEKTSETYDEVMSRGSREYHEAKRHGEEGWDEMKRKASSDAEWVREQAEEKKEKLKEWRGVLHFGNVV